MRHVCVELQAHLLWGRAHDRMARRRAHVLHVARELSAGDAERGELVVEVLDHLSAQRLNRRYGSGGGA